MRHRGTGRPIRYLLTLIVAVLLAAPLQAQTPDLQRQRQDYKAALAALGLGDPETFSALRASLDDYPLAIYLDYYRLRREPGRVSPTEAKRFLDSSAGTPLPNRFLTAYLRDAGKARRWEDFLAVKPDEPNSTFLKCYFFRAQLARGQKARAWEGASRLWVHGESQPKECDPLFDAWLSDGQLTDDIVWTRLLNAFEARQRPLLFYVAKKSSVGLRAWADTLLTVYQDPASLPRQALPPDQPHSRDIVSYGLAYLARYSPAKALDYWTDYRQQMAFSPEQVDRAEYAIALHALFAREDAMDEWLRVVLERFRDDKLTGIRLRWALAEEDWSALARYLPLLSEEGGEDTAWRYWSAMSLQRNADEEGARKLLQELALERDYYGFLAADRLDRPYAFNHEVLEPRESAAVAALPAIRRIEELKFHQESVLAHAEWYLLIQDADDSAALEDLMLFASGRGWHRMAIDTATAAAAWDALDQRFPTAHQAVFRRHASRQSVSATELMSIARRESAFYPRAESPVGARGLMQIMPATGKAVARSLGVAHTRARLFEVEHNVTLGSAYYRELLDRFDGNRIFALTGYNAGPHRVDRWRHKPGEGVSAELWVETIPYRETRNYVQAVLAYNVVFQHLLGDTQQLLTPAERQAKY